MTILDGDVFFPRLSDLLTITTEYKPRHVEIRCQLDEVDSQILQQAAELLAFKIMAYRMRGADGEIFSAWCLRFLGGPPQPADMARVVCSYFESGISLPANPAPADHCEALIGEHLWYFLTLENSPAHEPLRAIEGPDPHTTNPGPDGLVVYEDAAIGLAFRLWEIKKETGAGTLTTAATEGTSQLADKATQYLAQYTAIGEHRSPELADFYGCLGLYWARNAPQAGAAVSVASSFAKPALPRMFDSLSAKFPDLTDKRQLHGMLVAVGDFPAFAQDVRELMWKGL